MPFAASYSKYPDLQAAVRLVCDEITSGLNGQTPDLTFVFVSHDHADQFQQVAELLNQALATRTLVGCTGQMIAGGNEEIEAGPAISVWSAVLPDAQVESFQLEFSQTADGLLCVGFPENLAERADDVRAVFVLGEPFSSVPKSIIDRLADDLPGIPVVGGMASGARQAGENVLFRNRECLSGGAIGVVVHGGPKIRTVVSQGCRPIGTHYVVTKADQNLVLELGGKLAIERLNELYPTLPERDQKLVREGLHLGIAMNEYQESFDRGDFLISNVIGADPDKGAVAIGNHVRVGQTVRFHIRDAETADEDLNELLERDRAINPDPVKAALLFTCNGRGTRLFPQPNHDVEVIQSKLGPIPLAGFFAQGELGPVSGRNHVHGFTASVALFE